MKITIAYVSAIVAISVVSTVGIMLVLESYNEQTVQTQQTEIIQTNKISSEFFEGTNDIKKITSQEDLKNILEKSSLFGRNFHAYEYLNFNSIADDTWSSGVREGVPALIAVSSPKAPSSGSDYSTTNIQTENVDEPDYLKNDSKYVYIVSQNTLTIIDAYPADSAKIVLKIALDVEYQYIQNMFLNDNRLVIFYNGEREDDTIPQYDFRPSIAYSPVTHALIVDVSDKEHPKILKDYSIDGHFMDARMIGNYAYFVTNIYVDYQYPRLPVIMENSVRIMTPDAFYFDNAEQFSNFNTLTAIDIFGDTINSESFLMGDSGIFYASEDNFYITYQNVPFDFYEDSLRDRFFDVIVPLLQDDIQEQIRSIQNNSSVDHVSQWIEISELMQESYNQMDKESREKLFDKIKKALDEYDARNQEDTSRTIIHKISIDEENIKYVAKGSVPGILLNQFSMDEDGDRFRIAVTTERHNQSQGTVIANAVYVLDEQLNIVGKLDNIAPDESIFSSRFIEDRLYLVTFRQIDPFFVIDLSSDTPKILGELKIPGFSNYLHPYDENHLIGFGRDAQALGIGVQEAGIKIALFNVADVSEPKLVDDVIIGNDWTDSEARHNHKAFFFDEKSKVLSIPIIGDVKSLNSISISKTISSDYNWNGFYVFDVDGTQGFNLRGTIAHHDSDSHHYGTYNARTFHIDDVLYTVSDRYLKMNSLDDLEEINSIKLEKTGKFIDYLE